MLVLARCDESLEDYIDSYPGTLPGVECRSILRSIAASLHALHRAGYIHTDVKPENGRPSQLDEPALLRLTQFLHGWRLVLAVLALGRRWVLCDLESCVRVGAPRPGQSSAVPSSVQHTSVPYCPPEMAESLLHGTVRMGCAPGNQRIGPALTRECGVSRYGLAAVQATPVV